MKIYNTDIRANRVFASIISARCNQIQFYSFYEICLSMIRAILRICNDTISYITRRLRIEFMR